jgi:hypothetical protein
LRRNRQYNDQGYQRVIRSRNLRRNRQYNDQGYQRVIRSGINNISLLNSTGKFSCEEEGLYQISVSIVSKTVHSRYNIFKNNRLISWTYVSDDDYIDTGTTVAAVELKVNDTLWVMANTDIIDYLGWSCVTIIKIK